MSRQLQQLAFTFIFAFAFWLLLVGSLDPQELVAGLLVGIPSLALFHVFRGCVDRFVTEMEEIALELVEDLTSQRQRVRQAREQADAV